MRREENQRTRTKTLGAGKRTNNKLNPHMTSGPGIEPGSHWWEASALTTTPSLLPPCMFSVSDFATLSASQFEQEALSIHNRYRAIHNAPALTLNCEMSKKAAAYAQKLADLDTLVQSSYFERPEQGENIALGCYEDREDTAEEAIKGWYVHVSVNFWQNSTSGLRVCIQ